MTSIFTAKGTKINNYIAQRTLLNDHQQSYTIMRQLLLFEGKIDVTHKNLLVTNLPIYVCTLQYGLQQLPVAILSEYKLLNFLIKSAKISY